MDTLPKLSNAEWEVIKPLWDEGPMPARDVYAIVKRSEPWAYKTVKTMLSRLVAKGVLRYEQEGNAYRYYPCYTRDDLTRFAASDFVNRVFNGQWEDFVCETAAAMPRERVKELRARLKALSKEKKKAARGDAGSQ